MSTQSILELNRQTLLEEYEEQLLYYGDAFYVNQKFLVGEEVEMDRVQHVMNFHRLLCTDNCEMVEFIKAKIEGEVGCSKEKLCDLIKEYKNCHPECQECSDNEVLNECCDISSIGKTDW